ncbi:hypothetical protein [uncultured Bacteroides sp.]|uniref:hypothetical protein n=1 Tax=uncultured Bacteroides sp. TaxID=162156 RepID=UPI0025E16BDE|nr:hypothetical protein [uncultured Bacteroides sp.]
MKNIKRKHLLFALSALLSICFYACYDGEEWSVQQGVHRISPTKRNKQLTTSVARQWYELHYDPVVSVSTRSGGGDEMPALIKPKWANATERNRGRYEVVQMPILTRTSRIIVDEDTRLHFDELRMQKKLRNSTHLVILKDLKTGNIRSFISVFVGSYDYLKKTTRMSRNTYLYREKDFDGKVLFFKLNGSMINGWKYRDGKIVGKITPIDEDTKILMTRSGYWEEECRIETNYEYVEECEDAPEETDWDEEYGIGPVIRPPICENVLVPIDTRVCEYVWVEEDDDDIEGGVDPEEGESQIVSLKAKNIFQNSELSEQDWKLLEVRLDSIIEKCMGAGLYNSLLDSLNGATIIFQFSDNKDAAYRPETNILKWNKEMDSNELFHELFHAYQLRTEESAASFKKAMLNLEIETHYAHYLYLRGMEEYETSEWRKGVKGGDKRILASMNLKVYLDEKGQLLEDVLMDPLEIYWEQTVLPIFSEFNEYDTYSYDKNRDILSNFTNLSNITKDC